MASYFWEMYTIYAIKRTFHVCFACVMSSHGERLQEMAAETMSCQPLKMIAVCAAGWMHEEAELLCHLTESCMVSRGWMKPLEADFEVKMDS
jgi:hypothetical protein